MTTKTEVKKSFDCVEFKRQAQERLMVEYSTRQTEFGSYSDFIRAKVEENEWTRKLWLSIG